MGEKNDVEISAQGEHVRFTITDYDTYAYLIYELQDYADVRIDTEVTNQESNNNNNVGLVCRFSENGWYEANISSSGVYSVFTLLTTMHIDSSGAVDPISSKSTRKPTYTGLNAAVRN